MRRGIACGRRKGRERSSAEGGGNGKAEQEPAIPGAAAPSAPSALAWPFPALLSQLQTFSFQFIFWCYWEMPRRYLPTLENIWLFFLLANFQLSFVLTP